jgi:CHAT domain-containing protein
MVQQISKMISGKLSKRAYWQAIRLGIGLTVLGGWVLTTGSGFAKVTSPSFLVAQQTSSSASLLNQGKLHYEAGHFAAAAELWLQATQQYEAEGQRLNQAVSLSYLSLTYQELGDWDLAQRAIAQSLDLLRTTAANQRETAMALALALNTQGKLQLARGEAETAFNTWKAAEQTYYRIGDSSGVLGSRVNQAQALQIMGLYRRAEEMLQGVNQQLSQQPESPLKLSALRSLGVVWQTAGNLSQSQEVLRQSLAIGQRLNLPAEISASQFSLGNIARARQDWQAALKFYQDAATMAPSAIARLEAQTNQLSLLIQMEQWSTATALWQQIEPQLVNLPPSRTGVYARVNLATSWMKRRRQPTDNGEPSQRAIATHLATALQQARTLQDPRAESYALGQLGGLYEQTGQWQEAADLTRQALLLAQSMNAGDIAYRWQWQLGRIHRQQGNRTAAIVAYSESVNLLKLLRRELVANSPDIQFSFRESVEPVYRELVALLVQSERPSQVELRQARDVIEALQLAELENFLRSACLNATPQQIDQIDPSAAVIYPIILADRLTVILSLPGQPLSVYNTALAKYQVEAKVEQALESLNPLFSDQERQRLSQEIYDWLVRPAEPALKQANITTLVFVPDGIFRNLPMAVLSDGQQYLVEKYSIAITSGLQLLGGRSLTQEQRLQALIGGLTESRQGFSALPGVAVESQQIAAELSNSIVLKDKDFTQTGLQNRIRETAFPVIHLATHGQFSSKPEDTFLLTWDNRLTIEGLRSLLQSRIESGDHPIELLVLSACETAEGDQRATLGLAGMAIRSGARSTLATLWSVNDKSTARLMAEFYQAFTKQGLSRAAALRQAQLTILSDPKYRHPFYWAPFILVGNWL